MNKPVFIIESYLAKSADTDRKLWGESVMNKTVFIIESHLAKLAGTDRKPQYPSGTNRTAFVKFHLVKVSWHQRSNKASHSAQA